MQRINNKGFGVIEVLLIIVVIGVIGSSGWYVWNQQEKSTQTSTTEKSQLSDQEPTIADASGCAKDEKYSDNTLTVYCPAGWKGEVVKSDASSYNLELISQDYALDADGYLEAGNMFEISISKNTSNETFDHLVEVMEQSAVDYSGNYSEVTTVENMDVAASNHSTHSGQLYATGIRDENVYFFRLNDLEEDSKESLELFKKFLASIDLK